MDYTAIFTALKPILAQGTRDGLRLIGMGLATHGFIESGAGTEAFIGAGMTLAGLFWGWFTTKGYLQVGALLQKVTATKTSGDAVKAATVLPPAAAVDTPSKSISVQSVVKVLLVAFLLSAFLAPQAFAQKLTGNIARDIAAAAGQKAATSASTSLDSIAALAKPFQDIAAFIGDDADGAVNLATVIPALQDGHGQQCWMAMKQFGDVIKAHPVPITFHIIQDYETLRLLGMATNNLCSNVHCTQVFADATAMAQAASPMPLTIPSLHDLCTKVPQIAVVAPVSVPAPSASPTP